MASPCSWHLVLLFVLLCVSCSDRFRMDMHRRLNSETLRKLDSVGGRFPVHCRLQRMKTKALDLMAIAANTKTGDRILIAYQVLCRISNIYRINVSSIIWNENEMEYFETVLHQQIRELGHDLQMRLSKKTRNIKISKYFAKMRRFLQNKEYSQCAWELIRIETRKTIENIFKLLE